MENTQLLFEEGVPLVIHSADREDVHTVVTVKIHLNTRSPTHRKVLHTQLTDDSDPFFFLSLYLVFISTEEGSKKNDVRTRITKIANFRYSPSSPLPPPLFFNILLFYIYYYYFLYIFYYYFDYI